MLNHITEKIAGITSSGSLKLVAGTVFGVDANHIPLITSHWAYIPAKQGARMMKRRGIVQ